ncbi:MAG: prepilin-type N-terminal cleavage/methylation domain-containing protein [bacterium]
MYTIRKSQSGFTLVEILFVLGIIVILSSIFSLSFSSFRSSQVLKNNMDSALSLLYEARTDTISGLNGTTYGVNFETNQMTFFSGSSYAAGASGNRVVQYDTGVTMSAISLSDSGSQIIFNKITGVPNQYGTITLTAQGGSTKIITIGASGSVSHS